jgi:hypothetical protein
VIHDQQILAADCNRGLALPEPRVAISIRLATMEDIPSLDALQKKHGKALGFFPRAQMEGYVRNEWVLIAQEGPHPHPLPAGEGVIGYIASRDRYLKRDELGIIYQLCVSPGVQRKLVGAALVREVFARSAYGCRLYCCWCAQDLDANHFWEAMGFVPIAFRAGSDKKRRVHIFWQKRIVSGDAETKWWYPHQTNQGAIREDRLVFPIPPGTHWSEVTAVATPKDEGGRMKDEKKRRKLPGPSRPSSSVIPHPSSFPLTTASCRLNFAPPKPATPAPVEKSKRVRERKPKVKIDPKLISAARELRDRYLEELNNGRLLLPDCGRYDVSRQIAVGGRQSAEGSDFPPTADCPLPTILTPRALPRAA